MSTQETLKDVPNTQVETVVHDFQAIGAATQVIAQGGDKFTVVATFNAPVHLSPFATKTEAEVLTAIPPAKTPELAPPSTSTNFTDLSTEYLRYFDTCEIRPERLIVVKGRTQKLRAGEEKYRRVGDKLGIPWFFIGIIHSLEANFDFTKHLHNGDPLTGRTIQVPKGRPVTGSPPFTWEESAEDALRMRGLQGQSDWSTSRLLYRWEGYNGFGYRPLHVPTPYLWSFSQHYTRGRFVKDHQFSPTSVSEQCGAAVIFKAFQEGL